jgi:hypothetical protein
VKFLTNFLISFMLILLLLVDELALDSKDMECVSRAAERAGQGGLYPRGPDAHRGPAATDFSTKEVTFFFNKKTWF